MVDLGNINDSSVFIDHASEAIIVPTREEIVINDPDIYMARLDEIQSGKQRLIELLRSIFDPQEMPTHESQYIRFMALSGVVSGWIYGGPMRNTKIAKEYARKFNAATFEGKTAARKHFTDYYIYTTAGRGIKHAVAGGLLCGSAGSIAFGSMTYRNCLYYPDWAVGFTIMGALTRFWSLGVRGAIAGGCFGLVGGTIGYGLAKLYEKVGGKSIPELRFHRQMEWLRYREKKRETMLKLRERTDRETVMEMT